MYTETKRWRFVLECLVASVLPAHTPYKKINISFTAYNMPYYLKTLQQQSPNTTSLPVCVIHTLFNLKNKRRGGERERQSQGVAIERYICLHRNRGHNIGHYTPRSSQVFCFYLLQLNEAKHTS